ncbi:DUF4058 family protein [Limnoglobus roseus]|uniref:DUF4058 domain-containing protein n=1 Tax=Limnoglobus roseus TaxID=2598579 RepID=A0A5C1A7K6_9BACT|nr:DUF4058 family protein [Limnoglobus roseus]QEL13822.1 hypothetical protein PX52LOC_00680 [Limnoglobus roseus]
MPLRDHFHSPLNDRHSWDVLHGGWPMEIAKSLNRELPPEYVAGPQVHLGGGIEIDVGALESEDVGSPSHRPSEDGTAAWAAVEPTVCVETERPDVDEYEVRVFDVSRERRLVAAIELVSPSNKDRPESRRAFVAKCASLLQQDVCVTIVDVVTSRDFNLYADLLTFLDRTDVSVGQPPVPIYAVTCRGRMRRGRWVFEAWNRPLTVGRPLPKLPLWLPYQLPVTLDLEATYEETCRGLRIR